MAIEYFEDKTKGPGDASRRLAFGVDATRPERYSLRQSRYAVLANDIDQWAGEASHRGETLSVLDVGCGWGPILCHLDGKPNFPSLRISATDLSCVFARYTYRKELYDKIIIGDLAAGYPEIASGSYDVVVCEQVLEHLADVDAAIATLIRIVRPGGKLIIGVPIFVPPLRLARATLVPKLSRILPHRASGTHQQSFSLYSIMARIRSYPNIRLLKARGFRVISGGLLRLLENYQWWWLSNMALGRLFPAICIEVQIIAQKLPED